MYHVVVDFDLIDDFLVFVTWLFLVYYGGLYRMLKIEESSIEFEDIFFRVWSIIDLFLLGIWKVLKSV